MEKLTAEQKFTKIKVSLIQKKPFYGNVLMRLYNVAFSTSVPTACTDGSAIYINKDFAESLSEGEFNYIMLHELYHVMFMHTVRRGSREALKWNIACDMVVNNELDKQIKVFENSNIPLESPKDRILPDKSWGRDKIKFLTAEEAYDLIEDTDDYDSGSGDSDCKLRPTDIKEPQNAVRVEEDINRILNEVKTLSNPTDMSGEIAEFLFGLMGTKMNWTKILQKFLTAKLSDEPSFSNPDRNMLYRRTILPGYGFEDDTLEKVLIALDVSGSISTEALKEFYFQVKSICEELEATGILYQFDVGFTKEETLESISFNRVEIKGRGGTDITPLFQHIKKVHKDYSAVVVFTDGYLPTPTVHLKNVIWILSKDSTEEFVKRLKGSIVCKI